MSASKSVDSVSESTSNRWKLYGDHVKAGFEESLRAVTQPLAENTADGNTPKLSSAYKTKTLTQNNQGNHRKSNIRRLSTGKTSASDPNFSTSKYKSSNNGVKRIFSSRVISSPRYGGVSSRLWKSTPSTTMHTAPPINKPLNLPTRVGDFLKIYPFNDVTKKQTSGNLDTRLVIRECFKQLKSRPATLQRLHEDVMISGHTELLNDYLWPPINDVVER